MRRKIYKKEIVQRAESPQYRLKALKVERKKFSLLSALCRHSYQLPKLHTASVVEVEKDNNASFKMELSVERKKI